MVELGMYGVNEIEEEQVEEEIEDEEFYETVKYLILVIDAVIKIVNVFMNVIRHRRIERPLTRRPISTSGYMFIHQELNSDPESFQQLYRMYPDVFKKLCAILREKTRLQDTRYVCVEEMLATFLLTVGQNSRYCVTCKTFGRSHWTTSSNFNQVLKALNTIAPDMMVKPRSTVPSKIRESTRFYPYFKDCIGAIDGTHISVMVSGSDKSFYRNRHGTISQNVLAACNFDLEFIYVLSGWEGSAHDLSVLNDALSKRNGLKVPQGKFLLADCDFANRCQFLASFRGVRYQLQDFTGEGHDPKKEEELFNLRLGTLRNVVERILGVFKSRFAIFKSPPPFPYKTQVEMVLACAGLHNFLRKECRSDEFSIELEDEESSNDDSDSEDEDEYIFQSQEEQREVANEWRASIASAMWNATRPNDNQ